MAYHPVTAVLTDGHGHFLGVVTCDCDPGDSAEAGSWELDYESCPVHSRVQLKGSVVGVLQPQGERREDASDTPPRPTGPAPATALPRRKW